MSQYLTCRAVRHRQCHPSEGTLSNCHSSPPNNNIRPHSYIFLPSSSSPSFYNSCIRFLSTSQHEWCYLFMGQYFPVHQQSDRMVLRWHTYLWDFSLVLIPDLTCKLCDWCSKAGCCIKIVIIPRTDIKPGIPSASISRRTLMILRYLSQGIGKLLPASWPNSTCHLQSNVRPGQLFCKILGWQNFPCLIPRKVDFIVAMKEDEIVVHCLSKVALRALSQLHCVDWHYMYCTSCGQKNGNTKVGSIERALGYHVRPVQPVRTVA